MSLQDAFAGIKEGQAEPEQTDIEDLTGKPIPREVQLAAARKVVAEGRKPKSAAASETQAKGRTGKNLNPAYHKLTMYIPQTTRKAVAVRIAQDGEGLELSTLVTKLLDGWTADRSTV